jgi:hypothetical protein
MMEDNISSQLLMGVARPWHMSKNTNQKSKKREKEEFVTTSTINPLQGTPKLTVK